MTERCPYCGESFKNKQSLSQHCLRGHGKQSWIPEETLRELYVGRRMRTKDIARELDTTKKTIRKTLNTYGIEQRDRWEEQHRAFLTEPASYRTREDGYERWSNTSDGETFHVYVHRLLAAAEYGFGAVDGKQVHHLNGVPWDNRPENIELIDRSTHGEMHAIERWHGKDTARAYINSNDEKAAKEIRSAHR